MSAALFVLAAAIVLGAGFILAAYRRRWGWAGFAGVPQATPQTKTLWDWLDLLVVPLALATVAYALNLAEANRDQRREDQRAEAASAIADNQRREDALAAYVQQMSGLLLAHNLSTSDGKRTMVFVRQLTLTLLPRLDGVQKGVVARFLAESKLIDDDPAPQLDLTDADLSAGVLHGHYEHKVFQNANLSGADFRDASLVGANFHNAHLRYAVFDRANLEGVDFSGADLRDASFKRATISMADFQGACLGGARLTRARIDNTDFTNAGAGSTDIDFSGATLSAIDLSNPVFSSDDVNLTGADLSLAYTPVARKGQQTTPSADPCIGLH
jgi:uncharacterized protein YjbI with pentapeptide repeats